MPIVARLDQYGSIICSEFDEFSEKNTISSGGTFYSQEFIENIDPNYSNIYTPYDIVNDLVAQPFVGIGNSYLGGQLTANVYPAYNTITSEFALPFYGYGTGTLMRYTIDNRCIIYNEIDEVTTIN